MKKNLLTYLFLSIFCVNYATCGLVNGNWSESFAAFPDSWSSVIKYHNKEHSAKYERVRLDPVLQTGSVLQVQYPEGSCGNTDLKGGSSFYIIPYGETPKLTEATIQYEVYFHSTFKWRRGGKLPGLYGGDERCSNGNDATTCFSARFMWDDSGDGYPYLYLPLKAVQSREFCEGVKQPYPCSRSSGDYAYKFNRTNYFTIGKWHRVKEHIKLNTIVNGVAQHNGVLQVWIDGEKKVDFRKIIWRVNPNIYLKGIQFETFYGGSDPKEYAPPNLTYTYFKSLKMWNQ